MPGEASHPAPHRQQGGDRTEKGDKDNIASRLTACSLDRHSLKAIRNDPIPRLSQLCPAPQYSRASVSWGNSQGQTAFCT